MFFGQAAAATHLAAQRIVFVRARRPDADAQRPEDLGLTVIDPFARQDAEMAPPRSGGKAGGGKAARAAAAAEEPAAVELFRVADVPDGWTQQRNMGAGLVNQGNTCFMNSVLQCLMHTPPLAELLLSGRRLAPADGAGGGGKWDPIKATRDLLQDSLASRRGYVEPLAHAHNLRKVCRSFRHGRQEDAHEYLIALLDAMHERALAGAAPRPPPPGQHTTFVYRVFGGRTRSCVTCGSCGYASSTVEPFLDLSLEIAGAGSVEAALARFTAGEALDGANAYRCPRQGVPVRAVKRLTLDAAPRVLVVQLKRFEFHRGGRKVGKQVAFGEALDLAPYMTPAAAAGGGAGGGGGGRGGAGAAAAAPAAPLWYDLYGVLVHQGHSMHSGHYFCFVKGAAGGEWHRMDDTRVAATSTRSVMAQHPYILFYARRAPGGAPGGTPSAALARGAPAGAAAPAAAPARPPPAGATDRQLAAARAAGERRRLAEQAPAGGDRKRHKRADGRAAPAGGAEPPRQEQQQPPPPQQQQQQETQPPPAAKPKRGSRLAGMLAGHEGRLAVRRPTHASPPVLGRSRQRLEEQRQLHRMAAKASSRRPVGALSSPPPRSPSPPPPPPSGPRRRAAPAAGPEPKRARRAAPASDSEVSAPEWPPVRAAAPAAAAPPPPAGARATGAAAAAALRARGGASGMGLDAWGDGADDAAARRAGAAGMAAQAPRRPAGARYDEYDAEYDRGRVKKVRGAGRGGARLGAAPFDAAAAAKAAAAANPHRAGPERGRGGAGDHRRGGGRGRGHGRGRGRGRPPGPGRGR